MDYILIIFVLVVVICMGYILSKPFTHPNTPESHDSDEVDLEDRYQMILGDIKAAEQDRLAENAAGDLRSDQPNQLNKVTPVSQMVAEGDQASYSSPSESTPDSPNGEQPPKGVTYCPQCGFEVLSSDKFCLHCGHPLQP
jgi:hypothetical protein